MFRIRYKAAILVHRESGDKFADVLSGFLSRRKSWSSQHSVAWQCGIAACVFCALLVMAEHFMFVRTHLRSAWVLYGLRAPFFGSSQRSHTSGGVVGDWLPLLLLLLLEACSKAEPVPALSLEYGVSDSVVCSSSKPRVGVAGVGGLIYWPPSGACSV